MRPSEGHQLKRMTFVVACLALTLLEALLAAPAVFHYVHYFVGFGLDQPVRIITGG